MLPREGERWFAAVQGLVSGLDWDRRRLRTFQTRRLRALVRHAYENVPYFRRLFDRENLKPEHIRGLDDLERIPPTSRADVQRLDPAEVVARGFKPRSLITHHTSGSTGAPLFIRRTRFEDRLLQAYRLRVLFRLGLRWRDRRSAVISPLHQAKGSWERLGLLRYQEVSCMWGADEILARLRAAPPDVLRGYPGTLAWLAGELSDADRALIRPRLVTTDSESLTPEMRTRIGRAFNAPVVDSYDSHEFNLIASECSAGLYHLSEPTVLGEVLVHGRRAKPGESGEFVGTALHSWAMPFIRYRQGDIVTAGPEQCSCGSAAATLQSIQGRTTERFLLPGGTSVHPFALAEPLMERAPWMRQFQMVQEGPQRVRVTLTLTPDAPLPEECLALVRRTVAQAASTFESSFLEVHAEVVDRISPDASGKFRPYRSLVAAATPSRP